MLSPDKRSQLDGIVQKAQQNGETDQYIQALVDDFKKKYDVPTSSMVQQGPPMGQPQSWLGKTASAIGNFGVGVAKEAASIGHRAAELGEQIGSGAANTPIGAAIGAPIRAVGKAAGITPQAAQGAQQAITHGAQRPGYLTPKGTAQKVGAGVENIGEFFLPVGGPSKLAASAGKIAEKLPVIGKGVKLGIEAAGAAAKTAIDFAARTGLQEARPGEIKGAAELGAVFGAGGKVAGEILKAVAPGAIKSLTEKGLNLTVPQKRNLGDKVKGAVDYIIKNNITGTNAQKFEKVSADYENAEEVIKKTLSSPEARAMSASKSDIISQLESLKSQFQSDRDVLAIERQINDAIKTIRTKAPENIPLDWLNNFKRTTFKGAFNNAGTKVSDAVEFNIGDIARSALEKASSGLKFGDKTLADFNQEYGTIIDTKKILKLTKDRPMISALGKVFTTIMGISIGNLVGSLIPGQYSRQIGETIGGAVGGIAGGRIAGGINQALMKTAAGATSRIPSAIPWGKASVQGITSLPRIINKGSPPVSGK